MAHDMAGGTGAVMIAAMIVMMLVMGVPTAAFLARAVPAAWRGRIRHTARRPAGLLGGTSKEGPR